MKAIGRRIQRHPLGFSETGILRIGRLRIVLHSWKTADAREDIHTHRFSFLSVVIRGAVTERSWSLASGTSHEILEAPAGCRPEEMRPTGNLTAVVPLAARVRCFPAVYAGRMGGFHDVTVRKAPALTVFIKLEHRDSPSVSTVLRVRP